MEINTYKERKGINKVDFFKLVIYDCSRTCDYLILVPSLL